MGGDLSDLRPISLAPPAEPALRHAARLIAMVHDYQRIRMCPAMAPSGVHWRCSISHADNVDDDGLGFRPAGEGEIALYSSGQGALYFGWEDGERLTARLMAARFLESFPIIASRGAGRDWAYAGWLTDVLGLAEHGRFIAFRADYPIDPEELAHWTPPPCPRRDQG